MGNYFTKEMHFIKGYIVNDFTVKYIEYQRKMFFSEEDICKHYGKLNYSVFSERCTKYSGGNFCMILMFKISLAMGKSLLFLKD